jgi:hypothetical protein
LVVRDKGGELRDGEDGDNPLDWALFCVMDICSVVGISCEGHEDQTVALWVIFRRKRVPALSQEVERSFEI